MTDLPPHPLRNPAIIIAGLAVLLVTLRLTGHVAWSWLWILSPLWLPIVGFGVIAIVMLIIVRFVDEDTEQSGR